ncbi:MAG: isoleucyl-tRNA synthetase [Flavobacteriaceae bacterium]|jgi:isoleucyl-tRNA synthetase
MKEQNYHTSDKSERALLEESILEFWKDNNIFKKSLEKDSPEGEYVFYEGPPTANGRPGIHHLEGRAFKDVIPRYKTMRGYHVRRKAGWDTHGLPVELEVEKRLGFAGKKDIEKYGIGKFNEECRASVWTYRSEWEAFTDRMGYWLDMENPYVTYHPSYMESVWNIVQKINEKGYLYKDYKVLPWCPRCTTALSSHELAQGYEDVKDLSVTAKFKIKEMENTYIIAWTTTPWTLPGNVALAVGGDIDYIKVSFENELFIVAKKLSEKIFKDKEIQVVEEIKGKDLIGLSYEPLYPYLQEKLEKENIDSSKAYKIYGADFVTTEDGTGVVHTAIMYGQDDFELGTKIGLPKYHLVNEYGNFEDGMEFLSGRFVKDEQVAIDVIKDLAHRGLLFSKEKYEHSYPHCWRCKTPMIYYARDSWYIAMSKLKDELLKRNETINWEPSYIKDGRFGEWLRDIKDWAISRERYWGTPLPIWENENGVAKVLGSIEDIKSHAKKSGNIYTTIRHGEAESNVLGLLSGEKNNPHSLTEKGKEQIQETVSELEKLNVDLIVSSPFVRTKETALLLQEKLGVSDEKILFDDRIGEVGFGIFEGQSVEKWHTDFRDSNTDTSFTNAPEEGESLSDVKKRMGDFLYDLECTYVGKNILIVSHGTPLWLLHAVSNGLDAKQTEGMFENGFTYFKNAQVHELEFTPLPHNLDFELDLHKPYIDEIQLVDTDGSSLTRTKEVLDVWFDSGAMPYAQEHYPFTEKSKEEEFFPADYISEGIDQTRGWFYTLLAISTLLGKEAPYKNCLCLGLILDSEGKKMSKSKGNTTSPWDMMNKYGADVLRLWMYSVNQPGEMKNFDERTVSDVQNKICNPLANCLSLYETYATSQMVSPDFSHALDVWIHARLQELTSVMTKSMEAYNMIDAVRAYRDFVQDFSTWYIRRSRERLKGNSDDSKQALATTHYILFELSKLIAPFAPFIAEDIYQKLKKISPTKYESVHLEGWKEVEEYSQEAITQMEKVREVVTLALEARQKAGIKVRQPLACLTIKGISFSEEIKEIIADEINVKKIECIEDEILSVLLDTSLTEELEREGKVRDLIRTIQSLRKEKGLTPDDVIELTIPSSMKDTISQFENEIKAITQTQDILFGTELSIIKINT